MRRIVAVCLVLLAACTPSEEGAAEPDAVASVDTSATAEPTPTSTPSPVTIATADCRGLGRVRGRGEITFIKDRKLMSTRPDGSAERCLAEVSAVADGFHNYLEWGPTGDRAIIGGYSITADGTTHQLVERPNRENATWSRPTGKSAVFTTKDGRLLKTNASGGQPMDISFLEHHDEVVYHPSGTHIAVVGTNADGTYGIYFATNLGQDARLIARGEKASLIYRLVFSHDGEHLFFSAQHPHNVHFHEVVLATDSESGVTDLEFKTLRKFGAGFTQPAVSPFHRRRVAIAYGDCSGGKANVDLYGPGTDTLAIDDPQLADYSVGPVGWLPNGDLVAVATSAGYCATLADLYVISDTEATLIARDVQGQAVRVQLPNAPAPPGTTSEVIA